MTPQTGPTRIVQILPATITIDEDGISNTVSMDCLKWESTLMAIQDGMDDANHCDKHGLPTEAVRQNVRTNTRYERT